MCVQYAAKNRHDYWRWIKNSREIRPTRHRVRLLYITDVSESDVDRSRGQRGQCSSGKRTRRCGKRDNGRATKKRIEKNRSGAPIRETLFMSAYRTEHNSASLRPEIITFYVHTAAKDFVWKRMQVAMCGWNVKNSHRVYLNNVSYWQTLAPFFTRRWIGKIENKGIICAHKVLFVNKMLK